LILAQISDPHVTEPGRYGSCRIDATARLARAFARAVSIAPGIEGIVITGDLVERGTEVEYRCLSRLLRTVRVPCWLLPGNHDRRDNLLAAFPTLSCAADADGIQYVVELGSLRLVMLDSLLPGKPGGLLGKDRLDWLERTLAASATPTVLFVHHPPPITGLVHFDRSALGDADDLAAVIRRHGNVVRVACGHLHQSLYVEWAGVPLSVCPSTAHRFELDLRADGRMSAVDGEPALQVHRWYGERFHTYTMPAA
jgi:3',5'-cyclic AMP phosphodiesterase CpdA